MRFAILALITSVSAWDFTAYGGQGCTGSKGSTIQTKPPGQTVCSNVSGRYAYQLTKLKGDTAPSLTITTYNQKDCNGDIIAKASQEAGCYNIVSNKNPYTSILISAN